MVDLTVTGTSGSGEHLLVRAPDGTEYRLPVDETLRDALRRATQAGREGAEARPVSPREIQALLRSGRSVDEIADEHDLPRERVAPFESPVLAERNFVTERARAQRVGHDGDSPTLGDLVVDRLGARGVDVDRLVWDARRRDGEEWQVGVTFVAAHKERTALWRIDLQSRTLLALDDEARWLSETDVSGGRRHLGPVDGPLGATRRRGAAEPPWARETGAEADGGADSATPSDATTADNADAPAAADAEVTSPADLPDTDQTEALLEDLAAHRGTRQDMDDLQDELDLDALAEMEDEDIPAAHPPASRPDLARDAQVLSLDAHRRSRPADTPAPDEAALDPRGRHPSGRGRRPDATARAQPPAPADEDAAGEDGATAVGTDRGAAARDDADAATPHATGTDPAATDGPAAEAASGADEDAGGAGSSGPATDDARTDGEEPAAGEATKETRQAEQKPAAKKPSASRRTRRSVPSWDEIVFGSRSDPSD